MPIEPGRNTIVENLFRTVTGFVKVAEKLLGGQTAPRTANYASFSSGSLASRNYDEEAIGYPVRDPFRALKLARIDQCSEVGTAIDIIKDDTFSSESGDSSGFKIGDYRFDGRTLVDPEIQRIGNACISRVFRGTDLDTIVEDYLRKGDAFRSIVLDEKMKQVVRFSPFRLGKYFGLRI